MGKDRIEYRRSEEASLLFNEAARHFYVASSQERRRVWWTDVALLSSLVTNLVGERSPETSPAFSRVTMEGWAAAKDKGNASYKSGDLTGAIQHFSEVRWPSSAEACVFFPCISSCALDTIKALANDSR